MRVKWGLASDVPFGAPVYYNWGYSELFMDDVGEVEYGQLRNPDCNPANAENWTDGYNEGYSSPSQTSVVGGGVTDMPAWRSGNPWLIGFSRSIMIELCANPISAPELDVCPWVAQAIKAARGNVVVTGMQKVTTTVTEGWFGPGEGVEKLLALPDAPAGKGYGVKEESVVETIDGNTMGLGLLGLIVSGNKYTWRVLHSQGLGGTVVHGVAGDVDLGDLTKAYLNNKGSARPFKMIPMPSGLGFGVNDALNEATVKGLMSQYVIESRTWKWYEDYPKGWWFPFGTVRCIWYSWTGVGVSEHGVLFEVNAVTLGAGNQARANGELVVARG